jgi:hypothetical protein
VVRRGRCRSNEDGDKGKANGRAQAQHRPENRT